MKDLYEKFIGGEISFEEYFNSIDQEEKVKITKCAAESGINIPETFADAPCTCNSNNQTSTTTQPPHQESTTTQQQQAPQMHMFNFVNGQQSAYVSGNVHLDNLFAICTDPYMIEKTIQAANEMLAVLRDNGTETLKIAETSEILNQVVNILKNPAASRAVAKAFGVELGFIDPATISSDDPDLAILKDMAESVKKLFNGKATGKVA